MKNENKRIEVVELKLSELQNGFGNPRKITQKKKEELRQSIEMFGDFGLILIDEKNNLIGGNQRVAVMKEIDPERKVLCKRLVGYSEAELRAINIKDNTHSGDWDLEALASWTADLNLGFDLDVKEERDIEQRKNDDMELIHYEKYDYVLIACRYETDYLELTRRLNIKDRKVPITDKRKIRARAIWYDKMQATIVPKGEKKEDYYGDVTEVTVLITCCLGPYLKETIKCLKADPAIKVKVIGCDVKDMPQNFNLVDKFYQVPYSDSPEYFDVIMDICEKENVNVMWPSFTKELVEFSKKRKLFEDKGIKVIVPEPEGLEIANDKILAYKWMAENGIRVPKTLITASADEAKEFIESNEGTFVVKARDNCGSRGFRIVGKRIDADDDYPKGTVISLAELYNIFDGEKEMLVQSYLPGTEYTVDFVLKDNKVICTFVKENAEMVNGVSRHSVVTWNDEAVEQCKKVAEELKLEGNIGFDLKCDEEGHPVIIDINPRITATLSLSRYAGCNMPLLALRIALGMDYEVTELKKGTSIYRIVTDYFFDADGNPIYE